MIKNFNFYDVYGFLLPGIILVALLWLPLGLVNHQWPEEKVASALIAIIFGYIIGHILQTIASTFFSSTLKDSKGQRRYPSNVFLDKDNSTFSTVFKEKLSEGIKASFHIDIDVNAAVEVINSSGREIDRRRQDAFFLCRSVLIKSKTASYAEQFEGLYAMMRGLALAFLFGLIYNAGWYSSGLLHKEIESRLWVALLVGLGVAILASLLSRSKRQLVQKLRLKNAVWVVASLCLALFALGDQLGQEKAINDEQRNLLLLIVLGSLFSLLRCYGAFREHTQNFAKAVYRDFYIYELTRDKDKAGTKGNDNSDEESENDTGADNDGDEDDDDK